jgi:hypothetical protein
MTAGYVLSSVAFQLPIVALLITGLVLVGTRSARIGPRSVLFARLGLGLFLLDTVLSVAWIVLLPQFARSISYSSMRLGQLSTLYGLVTTALSLAAVGLLIAAVVARSPSSADLGPPGSAQPWPAGSGQPWAPGSARPGPGASAQPWPTGSGQPGPDGSAQPWAAGSGQPWPTGSAQSGPPSSGQP